MQGDVKLDYSAHFRVSLTRMASEYIFLSPVSDSSQSIMPEMQGLHRMGSGMTAWVICRGCDGRGNPERILFYLPAN